MSKFIVLTFTVVLLKHSFINGDTTLNRVKRIVGGSDAPTGGFPYQISLRRKIDDFHFCSGSIIRASVILTAAHCVARKRPSSLKVISGSHNLNTGGTEHSVTNVIIHEKFNRTYFKRDIALIIISPPINFSSAARSIQLEKSPVEAKTDAIVSGWGQISEDETKPYYHLQYIHVKTIDLNECRLRSLHRKGIGRAKICTLSKKGRGACYYDSGGPLVANGRQIGILSNGEPCARNYPDVYIKVSTFLRWINIKIAAQAVDSSNS